MLVFSIHEPFRTLLLNSLKGSGFGQVAAAGQVEKVRETLKEGDFEALVVDLDAGEEVQKTFLQLVQEVQPSRLIIFPPDNDRLHPIVGLLRPATVLIKPFYLPDLLAALQGNQSDSSASFLPTLPESPLPTQPQQLLSDWLKESNALGVIILRQAQPPLLVGNLENEDLQEAGLVLGRFWQSERRMDLIRYFRPHIANRDVLLYATLLSEGAPLGLLFDAHTSLREARRVSQWFASRWKDLPPDLLRNNHASSGELVLPATGEEELAQSAEDFLLPENETLAEFEQVRLADLLGSLPLPDPLEGKKASAPQEWQPESDLSTSFDSEANALSPQPSIKTDSFAASLAALEETRPSQKTQLPPGAGEFTSELRQSYTYILLPRSPQATLEGEIGEELRRWMPDFCATLGYTLEALDVEPRYLMWTVNLPPAVSPGHVVRIVRDQSASHLAECIPDLAGQGNFWSSAHLILRSRNAPETSLIEDFIIRTRRRQGFLSA